MATTQKNIPALRFPEFKEEWEKKNLGMISSIKTGPFGSLLHEKDYVDKGTPIITVEHLGERGIEHRNLPMVSEKDKERLKSYTLKVNDIVFSRVGSVDRNSIIKLSEEGWLFSGRLLRIRLENRCAHANFLSFNLQKEATKHRIRSVAVGQTMPSLNTEILKCFYIFLPSSVSEQQKIAAFLSLVDTKIEQLTKKKALLEQYKKGMMQKLFSQEIRFKNEQKDNYPDWEEKKLGDIGKIITGKTPKTSNEALWDGDIQFITPSDIIGENKYQTSTERYVKRTRNLRILPPQSIIYTCIASIGKICISVKPCATNQQINALIPNDSYDSEYVYYSLLKMTPQIKATQATTTLPIINKTEFAKICISIPCISEQKKIANFLSAIDEKIELVTGQIKQARAFKKGLLQQMFI